MKTRMKYEQSEAILARSEPTILSIQSVGTNRAVRARCNTAGLDHNWDTAEVHKHSVELNSETSSIQEDDLIDMKLDYNKEG